MIGSSIVSSTEDGLDKLAKHARGVLVLLAFVQLVGTVLFYVVGALTTSVEIATGIVLGVIFGVLAIWARRNPLPAVVVGLTLYVSIVLLSALVDPGSLYNGLVVKAIIAAMFWNGISTGITYNEMKRTMAPTR